jgi:hypothetical protein
VNETPAEADGEVSRRTEAMFKRVLAGAAGLSLIAVAMLAATPGGVSAADPTPTATPRAHTVIGGTGVLDAQGNGVAAVRGAMDLSVSASEGMLLVRDFNHNAVVHVDGNGQTAQWLGFTVYFGFNGNATVKAPDAGVIVVGKDIDLHVAGRGWAFLKGNGTFTANGHGPFPWTPDGTFGSVTP